MARLVALLRGVNLAGRNRVSMRALRKELEEAGFADVVTYLQSGNVVLTSRKSPDRVATDVERVLAGRLGLEIRVLVRTRDELAAVVERNPLGKVATSPKLYQVAFLESAPSADVLRAIHAAATPDERVEHSGRELYAWYPNGVGRSKLGALIAGKALGVTATARNWRTVTQLLELADPGD